MITKVTQYTAYAGTY